MKISGSIRQYEEGGTGMKEALVTTRNQEGRQLTSNESGHVGLLNLLDPVWGTALASLGAVANAESWAHSDLLSQNLHFYGSSGHLPSGKPWTEKLVSVTIWEALDRKASFHSPSVLLL